MEIIKKTLSLLETLQFIKKVVDNCFDQDDLGNDIEYLPQFKYPAIKEATALFYTDYEKTDDLEVNYITYRSLNIETITDFDMEQYDEMLRAASQEIEFRKQKLLQPDNSVTKYVTDLIKTQIEVQKLQKKVLQQNEKINKSFTPDEIKAMNENIELLNKNVSSPDFQKGIVSAINTVKQINRPQDHKRSKKVN